MTISPFDSAIYRDLLCDPKIARLFSDSAEVRAMMLVAGTLAKVQGESGLIPPESGAFLHRAAMEVQIDPSGLAHGTAKDGTPVPALMAALQKALEAPEHAQYLQFETASDDVQNTAFALRLRQSLRVIDASLQSLCVDLATVSPNLAGETKSLTSALILHQGQIAEISDQIAQVSYQGDAGLRSALAAALGLSVGTLSFPEAQRVLASWLNDVCQKLTRLPSGSDIKIAPIQASMARHSDLLNAGMRTHPDIIATQMLLPQLVMITAHGLQKSRSEIGASSEIDETTEEVALKFNQLAATYSDNG